MAQGEDSWGGRGLWEEREARLRNDLILGLSSWRRRQSAHKQGGACSGERERERRSLYDA